MGSLKSETIKYDREYQGTRTRERLRWEDPAAYTKDRPVLSSERAPSKKQDRISQIIMGLDTKTY
jgi:IS5 family transposase